MGKLKINGVENFLKLCTKVSQFYIKRSLRHIETEFPSLQNDQNPIQWEALKFFLDGYAFERQGRSPDYAPAAVDTITDFQSCDIAEVKAKDIWDNFANRLKQEGDKQKVNERNNPLCPKGTRYTDKNGRQHETNQPSVIELLQQKTFPDAGKNLVVFAKNFIDNNQIRDAHDELKKINGIGDKIASFFLRDIAVFSDKKISDNNEDRYLLQPIDTWIRYSVYLCQPSLGEKQSEKIDRERARFIVNSVTESEEANQGIWYFCSQVANSSRYKVRRSFENTEYMNSLITEHLDYLKFSKVIADDFRL